MHPLLSRFRPAGANVRIATHSGSFHADDVFALSVLLTLLPEATVLRTRDPKVWAGCNFLVDVGGEYDPARGRFDHHQPTFHEEREGVHYASSGLVWKEFGRAYLQSVLGPRIDTDALEAAWLALDRKLAQPLDLADTGQGKPDWGFSTLPSLVYAFNATWLDESHAEETQRFVWAVDVVQKLLAQAANAALAEGVAEQHVLQSQELENGKVLLLQERNLPWREAVLTHKPNALFVVYPRAGGDWGVQATPVAADSFQARKNLPAAWGGKDADELAQVCGVPDAVFCHKGLFVASARSQEGALRMARLAVQD